MKSLGSKDIYEPDSAIPASDFFLPIDAVQQLLKGTGGKDTFWYFSVLFSLIIVVHHFFR